jgi:hypothetical protein
VFCLTGLPLEVEIGNKLKNAIGVYQNCVWLDARYLFELGFGCRQSLKVANGFCQRAKTSLLSIVDARSVFRERPNLQHIRPT